MMTHTSWQALERSDVSRTKAHGSLAEAAIEIMDMMRAEKTSWLMDFSAPLIFRFTMSKS